MKTAKTKYIDYVAGHYVPIFIQDWYLDAVSDVPWDVLEIQEKGETIGFWPYMQKNKFGVSYIIPPMLCPFMGPVFFEKTELNEDAIISQFPKHQLFIQDILHNTDHLHIDQGNKWTYVFENVASIDDLILSNSTKRNIRKAEKTLSIKEVSDFDVFFDLLDSFFSNQQKENPYDKATFKKLDLALSQHHSRKIFFAIDENNVPVALEYMMEDEKWVYNFANGYDNSYRHNGVSLLLWHIIKYAFEQKKNFDFEGSMIPGVETFFKSFGATKKPYLSITKSKNILTDLILKIKNPNIIQ